MEYLWAFLVGGAICAIGQILIDKTSMTPARILVLFLVTGIVLGGLGIYQPLVDFAGAGASVPLTGFGNLLASGMREAIDSTGAFGMLTGGFTACAGGVSAAIISAFLVAIIFKPKDKS